MTLACYVAITRNGKESHERPDIRSELPDRPSVAGAGAYFVDGTPADCIIMGLEALAADGVKNLAREVSHFYQDMADCSWVTTFTQIVKR